MQQLSNDYFSNSRKFVLRLWGPSEPLGNLWKHRLPGLPLESLTHPVWGCVRTFKKQLGSSQCKWSAGSPLTWSLDECLWCHMPGAFQVRRKEPWTKQRPHLHKVGMFLIHTHCMNQYIMNGQVTRSARRWEWKQIEMGWSEKVFLRR